MNKLTRFSVKLTSLVFITAVFMGCIKGKTGAFVQAHRIETELKRGLSTKLDVRRILGTPKGLGGSLLPQRNTGEHDAHEIWLYDDIEITNITSEYSLMKFDMRQNVLLIFFKEETFDGFMWYLQDIETN